MDELEFRRRILAEPSNLDEELIEFAKHDQDKQTFVDDMQAFDEQLKAATEVAVPANLAARIIAHSYAHDEQQPDAEQTNSTSNIIAASPRFRFKHLYLAAAASFLVAISVFFITTKQHSLLSVGEHALAHLYHEINSLKQQKTFNLDEVNQKFATIGGQLDALPGKVTYLMFCDFQGKKGLHLVFESEFGPMTVFIVPSDEQPFGIGADDFRDQRFAGHINRGEKADTVLIASIGAPLGSYNNRINEAIRWL
ncbi:DUF3379 family protein [Pseudoalteromonas mariniglutinosa]|uniref:DUF3379 family protein n=1 Tax=Pseudoalteromonas mariniglutinosa TaxID=206042 RepID=UPI00384D38A8